MGCFRESCGYRAGFVEHRRSTVGHTISRPIGAKVSFGRLTGWMYRWALYHGHLFLLLDFGIRNVNVHMGANYEHGIFFFHGHFGHYSSADDLFS